MFAECRVRGGDSVPSKAKRRTCHVRRFGVLASSGLCAPEWDISRKHSGMVARRPLLLLEGGEDVHCRGFCFGDVVETEAFQRVGGC
jgi:hypothetical protein